MQCIKPKILKGRCSHEVFSSRRLVVVSVVFIFREFKEHFQEARQTEP